MLNVCVIGAGAAGLAALRHLLSKPSTFQPVAFELSNRLGGTWVYTDDVGKDKNGLPIHSSMYKNLKTNLPKEVMAFPDFAFSEKLPSFMKHQDVLQYLEDYAEHFDLHKCIKFKHQVVSVRPTEDKTWTVQVREIDSDVVQTHQFDAVMICNGHYSDPLYPSFPGLDKFEGEVMHSHNYREPETFRDKRVMCVGGGASGTDIAIEMSSQAKHVTLYHRRPKPFVTFFPDNVEQKYTPISNFTQKQAVFSDGTTIDLDAIVLCTGYKYTFPFLDDKCQLKNEDEYLSPLYKHLIHTKYPSLSFVGVPKTVCPFPQFDCQVRFVLAGLEGTMALPSEQEMNQDMQKDLKWRMEELGMAKRHGHNMGTLQWGYNDDLAKLAGFPPIPRVVQKLYDHVHEYRVTELPSYKKREFRLVNDQEFKEVQAA